MKRDLTLPGGGALARVAIVVLALGPSMCVGFWLSRRALTSNEGASIMTVHRELEPIPTAIVGGAHAPPEFDLTAVESGLVLSDGRIAAYAPLNPPRLLLFDASGAPVGQLFRRGRGPLEVVFGTRVSRGRGDTILLVDPINQRLSWISAENGVVRQRALSTEQARRFGSVAGELNDGFVVLHRALGLLDDAGDTRLDEGTRRRIWAGVQVAGPGDLVT